MRKMRFTPLAVVIMVGMALLARADDHPTPNVDLVEAFIDAFYSFDPEPLGELLEESGDTRDGMLFYQGWAQGGNYIVMKRRPCKQLDDGKVRCSITVQDDLVLALGIDFDVTDTFTLTIEDGAITTIDLSTDDPKLYHDARHWVWSNRRDLVGEACDGDSGATPDPKLCVRNALEGYRAYAQLNGLTPRAPK